MQRARFRISKPIDEINSRPSQYASKEVATHVNIKTQTEMGSTVPKNEEETKDDTEKGKNSSWNSNEF